MSSEHLSVEHNRALSDGNPTVVALLNTAREGRKKARNVIQRRPDHCSHAVVVFDGQTCELGSSEKRQVRENCLPRAKY